MSQPNGSFFEQIKLKYEQLSPTNKKRMIGGGVVMAVLMLATVSTSVMEMFSGKEERSSRRVQLPVQNFNLAGKPTDDLAMQELATKQKKNDELVQKILRGEVVPGELDPAKAKSQNLGLAEELDGINQPDIQIPLDESLSPFGSKNQPMLVEPPSPTNRVSKDTGIAVGSTDRNGFGPATGFRGQEANFPPLNDVDVQGPGATPNGTPAYALDVDGKPMPPVKTQQVDADLGVDPVGSPSAPVEPPRRQVAIRSFDSTQVAVQQVSSVQEEGGVDSKKSGQVGQKSATATESQKDTSRRSDKKEKEYTYMLPAGSIITGVLISGMDAPTSNQAKSTPVPALVRLKLEAILPNRFRMDLRECLLVVSGFGELSTERALIRARSLSCIREDGGVIEVPVEAYAVGEDGKAGVRGNLITRNGQLIAQSIAAGFMGGAAEAFGKNGESRLKLSEGPNVRGGNGGFNVERETEIAGGDIFRSGVSKGISQAANQVAEYYIEMSKQIFPTVEVNAGRVVDFVVLKGTKLALATEGRNRGKDRRER